MLIGMSVNPVAGMGGPVGLKGTDGKDVLRQAISLGAVPMSEVKARRAMSAMTGPDIRFLTGPDGLGEDTLRDSDLDFEILDIEMRGGAEDTVNLCRAFLSHDVDLIIFSGGDGTARDIMDSVGTAVPVLGIPAGVKMFSAVFTNTPEEAGDVVTALRDGTASLANREVLDIDEDLYRQGVLASKLYGQMKVPYVPGMVQESKGSVHGTDEDEETMEAADYIAETMDPDTVYLMGPGTGVGAIMESLGLGGTMLGFDAVRGGKLLKADLGSKDIEQILDSGARTMAVLGVIGGQGFLLGRGNAQLTPGILSRLGKESFIVIAPPFKTRGLKALRVDTGDPELDSAFRGHIRVVQQYGRMRIMPVA